MKHSIVESKTASVEEKVAVQRAEANTLRKWVTIAGIGLIVMIIAADSYEAWQDYQTAMVENQRVQAALCRALAEQTARMVQEVDVVLADFSEWRESPQGAIADEQSLRERLRTKILHLPFIQSALIANREGQLLASTRAELFGNRSLQKSEVFSVPERAHDDALYIGKPFIGRRDGARSFALSRRINSATGEFDGIVVARLSIGYLAALYSGVSVTPDTAIRLVRADGSTLAEYSGNQTPSDEALIDDTSREAAIAPDANAGRRIEVAYEIDGYPMTVQVSRSLSDVVHPWAQRELASALRTLALTLLAALLLVALRSALLRHDRGEMPRRRLEQELESVHRAEALGFLAASVAHDFNNVLTAIVGYAELAKKSLLQESAGAANLDRLLSASERARLLVRKVLTFDANRSVNYQPLTIEPIVREVCQQIQATLPSTVILNIDVLNDPASILGDATEVHQVVMNLCSNAIHAMPGGGTLDIRLELVDVQTPRDLALGRLGAGQWVRVVISDTGVGMAPEQIKTVFEPFYTTRQAGQGTGIGMTVVRNILMRMNGALDVESEKGVGTRMSLYWPRVSTPSAEPRQSQTEGGGETILIVDDEAELVELAEETLASLGYEPVGFSDARAAQEAFRRDPGRFDAVLTDERMQPLRGLELAKSIREMDPTVPVILMTGHRDAQIDAGAQKVGIAEILDKPLRAETLRAALTRQLARKRLA